MKKIIRIAIKSISGDYPGRGNDLCEKLTISRDLIKYEEKTLHVDASHRWSHKISSPSAQALFDELKNSVTEIMDSYYRMGFACDVGSTEFVVTYEDKTKKHEVFYLPSIVFAECFSIVKKMIPECEDVPSMLITSDDDEETYTD